jgi:hypothetical protein
MDHPPFAWSGSQNNHIDGSAVYDAGSPYKSVMYWGCAGTSEDDHVEKNLSADDILSMNTLYP